MFRNEDIQEFSEVETERPELRARVRDKVNISTSGAGRNLALDQEEQEQEEQEEQEENQLKKAMMQYISLKKDHVSMFCLLVSKHL